MSNAQTTSKQTDKTIQIQVKDLTGAALDWAVAKAVGYVDDSTSWLYKATLQQVAQGGYHPSTNDADGGPLLDQFNITTIRADDDHETDAEGFATEVRIPQWFAQTDQWTGHSTRTSYEGEYMEPTFMIAEDGGYYGTTRLTAGMRALVAFKLGPTVEIPQE